MRTSCAVVAALMCATVRGAVPADLVDQVPGFDKTSFKVYSGYLTVKGPFAQNPYDELHIHYQLDTSQRSERDAVVTWHQGGPGGSSMYGGYTEMGYFQLSSNGSYPNPHAWNKRANMLYLESPAGSSDPIGFSYCVKDGKVESHCHWNDTSQAEAYARTLEVFFQEYPEYKNNELYLAGESYAGQYVPNIATYIVDNKDKLSLPRLQGILVGNGCWGGDAHRVHCNGPHAERNDVDLFFGKGMVSRKLRDNIYKTCGYEIPHIPEPEKCAQHYAEMETAVGPHNVYNVYDNCPDSALWSQKSGKSLTWLRRYLADHLNDPAAHEYALSLGGGYDWSCGGMSAVKKFFERSDVQQAMHLGKPEQSRFEYTQSGPASVTLYPKLVKNMRVLIYNGDADACVPYLGNEEWTTDLADTGALTEIAPWHPWYYKVGEVLATPTGYATSYNVTNATYDFTFITIRLAGHMVPTFQPGPAYSFFSRFLDRIPF
eukprot:TRINITY_DN7488_c1_g1_i1.p1 TRINITY_DN7488_c1_g1~~TRINITY_DN7488_c1_g1_i1.p1  ORF type:complete len:487 (+),score=156.64 TRINITY_DN7488_c1_g1_i1:38-1498(+)